MLQIDGVWHTSLVVGGVEYYYGHGINSALPGTTPCGTPVQKIDLGCVEGLEWGRVGRLFVWPSIGKGPGHPSGQAPAALTPRCAAS